LSNDLGMGKQTAKSGKTAIAIDRRKVDQVQRILATGTMAETVGAALDEVLDLAARRRILERIDRDGGIGPDPDELRRLRAP
jgi:Arc/MetJ family transcription regulator